jgi:hypothetical protein
MEDDERSVVDRFGESREQSERKRIGQEVWPSAVRLLCGRQESA